MTDTPPPEWAKAIATPLFGKLSSWYNGLTTEEKIEVLARALAAEREAATMAERERCAKIAETLIPNGKGKSQNVAHVAGHRIAIVIRAGE